MLPTKRREALLFLSSIRDFTTVREVESACHAASTSAAEYDDHVRRAAFNLFHNARAGTGVVRADDRDLIAGTLVGRIEAERAARTQRFEHMLQEKYDALNDRKFQAIVRCRRCGSQEVTWEEKQTRSADEAASVFCACLECKNRWVMR